MFKRLIWWSTGAVMGAGGSWWAKRKVKQAVRVAFDDAKFAVHPSTMARHVRTRFSRAVEAGRWAARDREDALKRQLEIARHARHRPTAALVRGPQATEVFDAAMSSAEILPFKE